MRSCGDWRIGTSLLKPLFYHPQKRISYYRRILYEVFSDQRGHRSRDRSSPQRGH